jgi:hypothetical protein
MLAGDKARPQVKFDNPGNTDIVATVLASVVNRV